MEAVPRGVQWKVCPGARKVWSPQQLLSKKLPYFVFPAKLTRASVPWPAAMSRELLLWCKLHSDLLLHLIQTKITFVEK